MIAFVGSHGGEHIVERLHGSFRARPADVPTGLHRAGLEFGIERVGDAHGVVLDGRQRRRQLLQPLLILIQELSVRVNGMRLQQIAELVRQRRRNQEQRAEHHEVDDRGMLRQESHPPLLVPTQRLHDEQMAVLVDFLRKVNSLDIRRSTPESQRFVEVQHGDVRKVRHPRHRLQVEEPCRHVLIFKHRVQKVAQDQVRCFDDPWRHIQ
mmetsp:Transcript_26234/g.73200  ORF Transcript_26234/g.73200 Transcript_26234/m.73200 type:complete len:209 (-) Transcript_26234:1050-1676(-)